MSTGAPLREATKPATHGEPAADLHHETGFGELGTTLAAEGADEARRVTEAAPEQVSRSFPVPKKTLLAAALLGAMTAAPYIFFRYEKRSALEEGQKRSLTAMEVLGRFRVFTEGVSLVPDEEPQHTQAGEARVGEETVAGETNDAQDRGDELDRAPVDAKGPILQEEKKAIIPPSLSVGKPPIALDDPSGKALDHFFDRLMAAERKDAGAIVRIVYYGDSIVASDFITGKLRRLFQHRFGDAGHGYALVANAFPGWFHIDVARKASDQWKTSKCIGPFAEDGLYGLGCVSFIARRPDEWFSMGTAQKDDRPTDPDAPPAGYDVSRFELEYLKQPGGGDVDLILDGKTVRTLSTDGADKAVAWETVTTDDGPHKLEVRTTTDKDTRLFGMRMERDVPGVTLTALGITGAAARYLDKEDEAHWAAVLKEAKPDLVVLAFGTNESAAGAFLQDDQGNPLKDPMGVYDATLTKVMGRIHTAVPDASLMLVGPPDMASKNADEGHSKGTVALFVDHQKSVAAKEGWAFWNQYKAMGGAGSMWTWVQSGLGNADMIHPTGGGGNILGKMEYLALMEKYEAYKAARR